ncbi:alpha/beta fold hydrolase [Mucilaginibacter litoreus]|uniref:Alpha/beta fold hydrolase n=1 Tax=Mucilaginibacter litoreus TaxID=1048221 RepID=A0ABW3ASN0_9SPHI
MPKVFLISGLGADKRLFGNIVIPPQYEALATDWLIPEQKDTLAIYAQKIANQYHITPSDAVIGVSLGGMIATEVAKHLKLSKVILISSIKTDSEAPFYFKVFRRIPLQRIIPGKLFTQLGFLVKYIFGSMSAVDQVLFMSMLKGSSPVFLKWAMEAVLQWKNDTIPDNLYHIIGDNDLVFPYQNIKNPTAVIKGGTHVMVIDRATEINALLADILT